MLVTAVFFVAAEFYLGYAERQHLDAVRRDAAHVLADATTLLERGLDAAATQVCLASQASSLRAYLDRPEGGQLERVTRDFTLLAANLRDVDQVRLLDEAGQEVIRVNRGLEGPVVADRLQDKSHRPYFARLERTPVGRIFTSPLDLNIENHRLEVPFKPVLRVGTPVADTSDTRRGGLIINWRMGPLLDRLRRLGEGHAQDVQLLEKNGYWLSAADPSLEFGWQVPARKNANFALVFPEVWSSLSGQREIRSPDGFFVFRPLHTRRLRVRCGEEHFAVDGAHEQGWWLVVQHGPEQLEAARVAALGSVVEVLGPLYVVCLACVLLWWRFLAEQRRHREDLEALASTDALTGLATRRSLNQALESENRRASRYGRAFGVIYIDLDGFKAINDALGHAVGDQVLVSVASILRDECREVDLPARLGGDEFVVLVSEIDERRALMGMAERLLERIRGLRWKEHSVGASIGVAMGPRAAGKPAVGLLRVADEAMYSAKRLGKNRVCGPLAEVAAPGGTPESTRPSHRAG